MVMRRLMKGWSAKQFFQSSMRRFFFYISLLLPLFSSLHASSDDEYTINFNNVSITEYIRFVSKITNINFIFQEDELDFTVTVVSEDPTTPDNVISTLAQVLRINGLTMLEQDDNIVIHKNPDVKQLAKLVLDGEKIDTKYPLITKVFSIKNEKAESVAAIIRPMISSDAILDVSLATNQIILTDITTNVEKVSLLIENIDSPKSPLSVEAYHVKHNSPDFLIGIADKIIAPIAKGNPFILVPQPKAQIIFIVSTPALIDRSISVLNNLDTEPVQKGVRELKPENVFIYKAKFHSPMQIERSLKRMVKNMEKSGYIETGFVQTIDSAKVIDETGSILFTGEPQSLNKVREILEIIDAPSTGEQAELKDSFYLYKPINRTPKELEKAISDLVSNLKDSKMGNQTLLETLESVRIVPSTQSLVFSGDPTSFTKLQEILSSLDVPGASPAEGKSTFYMYQLKHVEPQQLQKTLMNMAKGLEKAGVREQGLIEAIKSMKYIKGSGSVIFTGDEKSLKRLSEILPSLDQEILNGNLAKSTRSQFFAYKPKYLSGPEIEKALKDYQGSFKDAKLSDQSLMQSIDSATYVPSTNTLLFTGTPESLNKLEGLLSTIDTEGAPEHAQTFFLYQLQNVSKDQLKNYLGQVANHLNRDLPNQRSLYDAIKSMKWVDQSHSYMFSGTKQSLDRIKNMLSDYDTPDQKQAPEQSTFLMYELKYVSQTQMNGFLKEVSQNLKKSDIGEDSLVNTIESRKWVPQSNAYMFSGTNESLKRLQKILTDFDVESETRKTHSYFVYHLKHASGGVIEEKLEEFAKKMKSSGSPNHGVIAVIEKMKYIKDTNSLLLTGDESSSMTLKDAWPQTFICTNRNMSPQRESKIN
jgi:type III secretion protein C